MVAAALGVASVLLPWIEEAGGFQLGLSQPDGWLTVLIGIPAIILAWFKIRIGWMAAGFLAVFLGRDIVVLRESDSAAPGIGLWIGTLAFTAAAVFQLIGMVQARRSTPAGNNS